MRKVLCHPYLLVANAPYLSFLIITVRQEEGTGKVLENINKGKRDVISKTDSGPTSNGARMMERRDMSLTLPRASGLPYLLGGIYIEKKKEDKMPPISGKTLGPRNHSSSLYTYKINCKL